jgi:2'-5' RNA ligase
METIRAFIAVDLGEELRTALGRVQRILQRAHADVKWVKPENIHLTMAFLGNVSIDDIRPLETAMDRALRRVEPFTLKIGGTGTFGKPKHPGIIWAGIKESPPLTELHAKIVETLHAVDIEYDARPFSPHLTLGRVKSAKHIASLLDKMEREKESAFGSVEIAEALLIKSELKPYGAKYTVLHRTALL